LFGQESIQRLLTLPSLWSAATIIAANDEYSTPPRSVKKITRELF